MKIKDLISNNELEKQKKELEHIKKEREDFLKAKEELKEKELFVSLEKERIVKEKEFLETIKKESLARPYISNSWDSLILMLDQWRTILSGSLSDKDRDLYAQKITDIEKELKLRDYNTKK